MKVPSNSVVAQRKALIEQRDALERQINSLQKEAEAVQEISEKVRAEAKERNVSIVEIAYALVPELVRTPREGAAPTPRRERPLKRYKNPHNGEIIETKGGNHKILKQWKAQYGGAEVESWRQD
jgi:hypothetical protein